MHLDVLQDCKIVSTNELEKMFQPFGSIAGSIYRVSCTKSIYVHLQLFQKTLSCCDFFFVSGCHRHWPQMDGLPFWVCVVLAISTTKWLEIPGVVVIMLGIVDEHVLYTI